MQPKKPSRLLYVARHAAAEPESLGAGDHERDLTRLGKTQADEAQLWLTNTAAQIDAIWASDATRALNTAQRLAGHTDQPIPVQAQRRLYDASVHSMLNAVAEADPQLASLLVVGHQPTVSGVVAVLTGRHLNYPTGTIVAVGLDQSWDQVGPDCAWVHEVFRPESLESE